MCSGPYVRAVKEPPYRLSEMGSPGQSRWVIYTATQPVAVGAGDEVTVAVAGNLDGDRRGSEHAVRYTGRGANWAARRRPVPRSRGVCTTDRPGDAPAVDAHLVSERTP